MRVFELFETTIKPKIGDKVDFPDDTITDKGPCSGFILKIDENTVWFSVSDTVFETNWESFTNKAKTSKFDGYWSFINQNKAQNALINYKIDGDAWKNAGMPPKSEI